MNEGTKMSDSSTMADPREEAARRHAKFKKLVVDNSRLKMIEEEMLDLLAETRQLVDDDVERAREAEKRRQSIKHTELYSMAIIGPSGSTKSTSMEAIIEKLNRKRPGEEPILLVTIRSSTRNAKQLQVQILEAFQDPQADTVRNQISTYSPDLAMDALREAARAKKTYVVVLDESNNMIGRDKRGTALPMAKAIKSLVNDGVFSVVVMGTADAHLFFEVYPELNSRKFADIPLDPVDLNDPRQREYFFKFVGSLDREMERQGIVDQRIGLIGDVKSRAMIYDLSAGVVGVVSRVLQIALRLSQRARRRVIEWDDIKQAFWAWKAEQFDENDQPIKIFDPFINGPKAKTLENAKLLAKAC